MPDGYGAAVMEAIMTGTFVVSLDFELMWGVRDHFTKADYGSHVLGERQAVSAMLDLFERSGIHATWATVGFLMCEGRDELLARAPEDRPSYSDARLSNYAYLDETGASEREDPYYFAPSMVREILACPHQELSTHSFSHYYCLEPGQTEAQFAADLKAAVTQLRDWKVDCQSIVFARNQYSGRHVAICAAQGLIAFRGNETNWMYRSGNSASQSLIRRAARLTDTYLPLSGSNAVLPSKDGAMVDVRSSRFLRPIDRKPAILENLRLHRIVSAMEQAARSGTIFHLWWHPHNFGSGTGENMAFLCRVIEAYHRLADKYGMTSSTMAEVAATQSAAKDDNPRSLYSASDALVPAYGP